MDSRQLIDARFNRAVEIVQSLPKTGPIQTGYEEKLTMYSLYKQATVGNVTTPRPGMFDMLGRAKWDAWAKYRDLDQYEARWLYVDALLKTLNKYSDKTTARDLMDELRSYGGDSGNLVSSYTLTRTGSRGSSSSTSTTSQDISAIPPSHGPHYFQLLSSHQHLCAALDGSSNDREAAGDESRDLAAVRDVPPQQRPLSSVSFSSRYKTPLTTSFALTSPPPHRTSVPPTQPLPTLETPSAFADPHIAISPVHVIASTIDLVPRIQSAETPYRSLNTTSRRSNTIGPHPGPPERAISISLEHAMENMQAHLAALTERIDTLESSSFAPRSNPQAQNAISLPSRVSSGRGSPASSGSISQVFQWDIDDMGLWTLVLKPLLQNLSFLQRLLVFFLRSDQYRSPLLIVVRRLCLDISFIMVIMGALRTAWIRTGTRRREVGAALVMLWRAITGKRGIHGGRNLLT